MCLILRIAKWQNFFNRKAEKLYRIHACVPADEAGTNQVARVDAEAGQFDAQFDYYTKVDQSFRPNWEHGWSAKIWTASQTDQSHRIRESDRARAEKAVSLPRSKLWCQQTDR